MKNSIYLKSNQGVRFFGAISNFQLGDKPKRNLIVSIAYQVHREFNSSFSLLTNNYITNIKGET